MSSINNNPNFNPTQPHIGDELNPFEAAFAASTLQTPVDSYALGSIPVATSNRIDAYGNHPLQNPTLTSSVGRSNAPHLPAIQENDGTLYKQWLGNQSVSCARNPSIQEVTPEIIIANSNPTYTDESIANGGYWSLAQDGKTHQIAFQLQGQESSVVIHISKNLIDSDSDQCVPWSIRSEASQLIQTNMDSPMEAHRKATLTNIHQLITAIYIVEQVVKKLPKDSYISYQYPSSSSSSYLVNIRNQTTKIKHFQKTGALATRLLLRKLFYRSSNTTDDSAKITQKSLEHLTASINCVSLRNQVRDTFRNLRYVAWSIWGNNPHSLLTFTEEEASGSVPRRKRRRSSDISAIPVAHPSNVANPSKRQVLDMQDQGISDENNDIQVQGIDDEGHIDNVSDTSSVSDTSGDEADDNSNLMTPLLKFMEKRLEYGRNTDEDNLAELGAWFWCNEDTSKDKDFYILFSEDSSKEYVVIPNDYMHKEIQRRIEYYDTDMLLVTLANALSLSRLYNETTQNMMTSSETLRRIIIDFDTKVMPRCSSEDSRFPVSIYEDGTLKKTLITREKFTDHLNDVKMILVWSLYEDKCAQETAQDAQNVQSTWKAMMGFIGSRISDSQEGLELMNIEEDLESMSVSEDLESMSAQDREIKDNDERLKIKNVTIEIIQNMIISLSHVAEAHRISLST